MKDTSVPMPRIDITSVVSILLASSRAAAVTMGGIADSNIETLAIKFGTLNITAAV